MLYVAFIKTKPEHAGEDLTAKSHKWWNEGARPDGLKFLSITGTVGTTPNVTILETDDVAHLTTLVRYWNEMEFVIHPAVDLAESYRKQGMSVPIT